GRGYVLRRIMRRAMRHAHLLGAREPLMHRLMPALADQMGGAYPELLRARTLICETLELEEERFKQTLGRGLKLLDEAEAALAPNAALPGDVAFRLYDTFGFPLDLTQDVLRGRGRSVDTDGFDAAMARQKAEARKAWTGSGEAATERVWFDMREKLGATEFLGYDSDEAEGQVVALVRNGAPTSNAKAGETVYLIVNQTPFYGESGGQAGDTGLIEGPDGLEIVVHDTRRHLGDLFVHEAIVQKGRVKIGDELHLIVDTKRRNAIAANHSATHLLHAALRALFGDHVIQKGSLVAPDRLRFDFSHPKPVTRDDIDALEAEINAAVRANSAVETHFMPIDAALEAGAMALFGEKYGKEVRVVRMGEAGHSVELCGGIHVCRTGDIGLFKIVGEQAVAAGVRRIEAVTGEAAFDWIKAREALLNEAAGLLRTPATGVPQRVTALLDERKRLERDIVKARRELAEGGGAGDSGVERLGAVSFAARVLDGVPPRELKPMADALKGKIGCGVVALIAVNDGRASLVVGVTDDLTSRIDSRELVRIGAEALGGKGGGGRADMAQAGGPDGAASSMALETVRAAILELEA
ncbi:MAG: alanine--tRNA ligase, partial [Pseudomonadota bacterium]|nr:alanine--tRNA ligase [Pseudomonadota bacterium]